MLDIIKKCILKEQNLGKAIRLLRTEIENNKLIYAGTKLEEIEKNYDFMCDYMIKGYKDPQSDHVYNKLLHSAFGLYNSVLLSGLIQKCNTYKHASIHSTDILSQPELINENLENFVQEIAMASLQPDTERNKILQNTYSVHHQYMSELFNAILVSDQWPDSTQKTLSTIITSPTIDTNDAQLIISAIMLSSINIFDINKWMTLVYVYENATDEKTKQRAFVSWVLSTPKDDTFPEIQNTIIRLCKNSTTRKELLELQFQLFYCNNTDADNEKIQRDIIPNLIKNNKFEITRSGIIEKEDDPIQDIIDPGTADRELEEMEQSVNRMMDMQKSGSDIYFGGFAQMKRFPFFSQLCNWFCPFYLDHPQLTSLKEKVNGYKFMTTIFKSGPFCDSDKYSFALAMSSVIDTIPDNMKELLNNSESLGMPVGLDINTETPAYIRRMYLQDLYRFFRLYQYKNEFENPFVNGQHTYLFLSIPSFNKSLYAENIIELDKFLLKHRQFQDILSIAAVYPDIKTSNHTALVAISNIKTGNYHEAEHLLTDVLKDDPENEQALRSMAQLSFSLRKYEQSELYYNRLSYLHPENRHYALNLGISQISNDKIKEGMSCLFKLNFEDPDDDNVKRALAWGYLIQGKPDNSDQIYNKLLNSKNKTTADYLNAGYAKWFLSEISDAVSLFKKYTSLSNTKDNKHNISIDFEEDKKLMKIYNITMAEQRIMTDLIYIA